MTLDELSISEQHEYDIYADSLIYSREYQVECQYCKATAKGTWEQLERVEGWILAKRETCPKCAAEPEAEQAAKCQCGHPKEQHNHELRDEDGSVEAVICNDYACDKGGGCWGYVPYKATDLDKPVFKRGEICDGCHRTDMFVTEADSGKYCESCFEDAVYEHSAFTADWEVSH